MKLKRLLLALSLLTCQLLILSCNPTLKQSRETLPRESAYRFYKSALDLYNKGLYEDALAKLDEAISLNDQLALFYNFRADIFQKLDRDQDAIDSYQHVLKLHSHDPMALEKLGRLYFRTGQHQLATQAIRKAFAQKPARLSLVLLLADYYLHENRLDMALQSAQNYKYQSENAGKTIDERYFAIMGHTYYLMEKYTQAYDHFRKCRSSKTFTENEIILFIKTHFLLGRHEAVFSFLSGLDETQISKGDMHFYRGLYYYEKSNFNDALTQFELARNFGFSDRELFVYLGKLYERQNNPEKLDEVNKILNDPVRPPAESDEPEN